MAHHIHQDCHDWRMDFCGDEDLNKAPETKTNFLNANVILKDASKMTFEMPMIHESRAAKAKIMIVFLISLI